MEGLRVRYKENTCFWCSKVLEEGTTAFYSLTTDTIKTERMFCSPEHLKLFKENAKGEPYNYKLKAYYGKNPKTLKLWKSKENVISDMKKEILELIENGTIPKTISSFSELHDYIDGNELGGFCEDDCPFNHSSQEDTDFLNYCQDTIDTWIKSGMGDD